MVTCIPLGWQARFVLLCIVFALLEEAVTTSLTNMAPLLGGVTQAARITASRNYLEVVLRNSVVVFVPLFLCWGWLLSRYDFRPVEVLFLRPDRDPRRDRHFRCSAPGRSRDVDVRLRADGLPAGLHSPRGARAGTPRWWAWVMAVFFRPSGLIIPFVAWLVWRAVAIAGDGAVRRAHWSHPSPIRGLRS